ncbi:transient receptor potential cation channel subfamily M member-like 2 isoform X2 [Liolophura sinensis]|uniref:transient receptor potential cation channel subfamily M member-like 2 isoform X2 n=1 Tax=Liolophura sinensis TaxID=3198878 RepID=UPI0031594C7F
MSSNYVDGSVSKYKCDSMTQVLPVSDEMHPEGYQSIPMSHKALGQTRSNPAADEVDNVNFEDIHVPGVADNNEIKWIRSHLKCRVCSRYKPREEEGSGQAPHGSSHPKCYCGYKRSEHSSAALDNPRPEEPWREETHTMRVPTNAFGDIEFVGFGQKIGKYVRVDHKTDTGLLLQLMMNHWDLEHPNLLISVTGGAKNFLMKPRLKEVFRRGLMKAAQSTGAWIITGGTHAGVMKHVGEAVRDYGLAQTSQKKVIAIGIATWGCIQRKETLINENGMWPAHYRLDDTRVKKETALDSNHSHFILVDNGTQHHFGVEIPFRAELETAISTMKTASGTVDDGIKVPLVLLVLEGGPGTLETVYSSIRKGTPAVIVQGSGRVADILAYAYKNAHEEEVEVTDQEGRTVKRTIKGMDAQTEAEITQMIKDDFGERDLNTHVGRVRECLQNPDLLTVFQLDDMSSSSKDVDVAILKAMLKANSNQVMDQLRLALAWNRIDVAKSEIFTDDREWKTGSLDDIMLSAILLDRTDFVKLFLENGVSLREFLTIKRLLQLYNQIPLKSQLYQLLLRTKSKTRQYASLHDIGTLIKTLMGDFYEPLYFRDSRYMFTDADALMQEPHETTEPGGNKSASAFKRPERELFLWAVMMNRREMSKLFWEESKECIPSALVANKLLKSLGEQTEDSDLETKLHAHAVEYEDLAIGVLNECYEADEKRSLSLLVRELKYWGKATCVLIAVQADNKRFISHSACQALLNTIWMGQMSKETKIWKLLLCVLFPPVLFCLIRFEKLEKISHDKSKSEDHHSEPRMRRQQTKMSVMTNNGNKSTDEPLEDNSSNRESGLTVGEKFWFFFNAPVITFCYNVISYLAFLVLYSYILLVVFSPQLSNAELVLIVWVFTIFVEELRQVISQSSTSLGTKISSYLRDMWNLVDVLTILLFIIGMVLRSIPHSDTFEAARVILALNLITFFARLLHIFSVHKQLGPKLVMIGRMVVDLMYFVVILLVIIVGYGVASQAILYPNTELEPAIIINVLRKAYWQMFGELFLEDIEGQDQCTFDYALYSNNTLPRCPTVVATYVVPILLGFYMLLTNVLLLNLLIAMFSFTFQKIQDNTDLHWYFLRYNLIYDYYDRPPLPPPFIIVSHLYLLAVRCFRRCCLVNRTSTKATVSFRKIIERSEDEKRLELWEDMNRDEFMRKTQITAMESMENKVTASHVRLDQMMSRMDELQEQQNTSAAVALPGLVAPTLKMPPQIDRRLAKLEEQMGVTFEALDFIIKSLAENNMAAKSVKSPSIPNLKAQKQKEKKQLEEKAKKDKELVKKMIVDRKELHYKSRQSPYPGSSVVRGVVPDEKVYWEVEFEDYSPVEYTSREVLNKPDWADSANLLDMDPAARPMLPWNQYDSYCRVNRKSILGTYKIQDGLPLNPQGRTGLIGRGLLGRWGPNHCGDPVVTRWKRSADGKQMMEGGKPVLEFVAVQREDNKQWAFPGGFCDPGQAVVHCLRSEFTQEALGTLMNDPDRKAKIKTQLDALFSRGEEIYTGYADDPRNTDNAWLETRAVNYHDENGDILKFFELRAGEGLEGVTWLAVTSKVPMYGCHDFILQKLAQKRGCAF